MTWLGFIWPLRWQRNKAWFVFDHNLELDLAFWPQSAMEVLLGLLHSHIFITYSTLQRTTFKYARQILTGILYIPNLLLMKLCSVKCFWDFLHKTFIQNLPQCIPSLETPCINSQESFTNTCENNFQNKIWLGLCSIVKKILRNKT